MDSAQDALAVAQRFIAALERLDGEGLCAVLDDQVELVSPYPMVPGQEVPGSARCLGASVHDHMRNMGNVLRSLSFEEKVWRMTDDGLALFEAEGRAVMPDGAPYENRYLMIFEVGDEKIVRWHEYFNPVCAARANAMPLDLLPS